MDEYIKREDALDAVLFALVGTGYQSRALDAVRYVPTADVAPRAEVAKVIEEVKKKAEAYFWHQDSVATSWFIEFCDELKKKYTEGEK